jgi:tetratricopeptide (TPR) repeat protein
MRDKLQNAKHPDSAVASCDRAIPLEPPYATAFMQRGNAFKRLNRLDDAIVNYRKAISLKDDYAEAYNNLGVALRELRRHVEACADFEIADLLQLTYKARFGVWPRLNPPISFNEHILHRIIYDRDPKLLVVCDKLAVRRLIGERVGEEYVVPLLGVWERPREINWHTLPQKFVLKPNHSSGLVAIVDQSVGVDKEHLSATAEQWLSHDYFDRSLEWGYRGIPRRVLAEPFLSSSYGGAPDAQVHVFSGKAALISVVVGVKRSSGRRACWFDVTGRRIAVKYATISDFEFQLSDRDRQEMVEIAERVSQDFSYLRVDFFMAGNGLKIGELTPYCRSGFARWDPPELDEKLGQLWDPNCDLTIIPEYK